MSAWTAQNADYEAEVRRQFDAQTMMQSLSAEITALAPGELDVQFPFQPEFAQQHGFQHAGVITTVMDTASGFAALSLMEAGCEVLTVEFKANFLSPAKGDRFEIEARVVKPGRTITVTEAKAFACANGERKLCATLSATMMAVRHL